MNISRITSIGYSFWFAPPGVPEVPRPWCHRGRDPGSLAHHNAAAHHGMDDRGTGGAGVEGLGGSEKLFAGFLKLGYPQITQN